MSRIVSRMRIALALALSMVAPALAGGSPTDEQELRRIKEELWPRAYREGDAALLDRLLAAEFQMIDPEGGGSDKAGELEFLRTGRWVNRSFRFEIRRLDVFENGTAVVAGRGVVVGPESDPDGGYQYQSSNVLIRRDGRWQAISSHVSGYRPLTAAELAAEWAALGVAGPGCAAGPERRAAWLELAQRRFDVADATERQRRALEAADCLGDPDPKLRDEVAFSGLSTWLRSGALDDATRLALAERLLPWVEADEDAAGFRRPFAALALSEVARADRLAPSLPDPVRRRIVEAAARFLETTRDHRGFDAAEGWRHAVAHGADLVLQIGLHPATTAAEARRLFDALAKQIAPPGVAYVHGEPERLARAVFFVHQRGLPDDAYWDAWFAGIGALWSREDGAAAYGTPEGLARRHDAAAFLHALAFAVRADPGPASDRLAELAHRELMRMQGG